MPAIETISLSDFVIKQGQYREAVREIGDSLNQLGITPEDKVYQDVYEPEILHARDTDTIPTDGRVGEVVNEPYALSWVALNQTAERVDTIPGLSIINNPLKRLREVAVPAGIVVYDRLELVPLPSSFDFWKVRTGLGNSAVKALVAIINYVDHTQLG